VVEISSSELGMTPPDGDPNNQRMDIRSAWRLYRPTGGSATVWIDGASGAGLRLCPSRCRDLWPMGTQVGSLPASRGEEDRASFYASCVSACLSPSPSGTHLSSPIGSTMRRGRRSSSGKCLS